jgi:hypothetical protein
MLSVPFLVVPLPLPDYLFLVPRNGSSFSGAPDKPCLVSPCWMNVTCRTWITPVYACACCPGLSFIWTFMKDTCATVTSMY